MASTWLPRPLLRKFCMMAPRPPGCCSSASIMPPATLVVSLLPLLVIALAAIDSRESRSPIGFVLLREMGKQTASYAFCVTVVIGLLQITGGEEGGFV